MNRKELKIINKFDKIIPIVKYISLKQSTVKNSCNLFPKETNDIYKNIDKILNHKDDFIVSINSNKNITGVGIFLNEPNEKYLECLGGFFNDETDFQLMLNHLKERYKGNHIDFVFPLENAEALKYLKNCNGDFEKPQICMELFYDKFPASNYSYKIFELSKEYYDSYLKIHNDENIYWTAKRIIEAPELFKTFIIEIEEKITGYIDVTYNKEITEIYNLYVSDKNKEYIAALINVAVINVLNKNNKLIALVDDDDSETINIYKDFGFIEKYTSQTISIDI